VRNFNAAAQRYQTAVEVLGRRVYMWPKWLSYQIRRSRESYLPALRTADDRKPWTRMVSDMVRLTIRWRCLPFHYIRYALFRRSVDEPAMSAVLPETTMYYVILPRINDLAVLLDDKHTFKDIVEAWDIPTPRTVLAIRTGRVFDSRGTLTEAGTVDEHLFAEHQRRLVLKPASFGSGGKGIAVFHRIDGRYSDTNGVDLAATVWELARRRQSWLLEEHIEQCPETAMPHPASVNSLRVMTWLHPRSGPRVIYTMLKCGVAGRPTDNAHTDGLYVRVHADGSLDSTAWDEQLKPHRAHPDTGFRFASGSIPHIGAVHAVAMRCADAFPSLTFAGWDVAVTPAGPLVIEGNSSPGLTIIQRTYGGMAPTILSCLDHP
jgi:hypothetical protein